MSSVMSLHQRQSGKQDFPLRLFAAAFVISLLTTSFTGWLLLQDYNSIEEMSRRHIALTEGVGRIMLFDESLTMSARLYAATGDLSYEKRYDQFDPQLTAAINDLRAMLPQREIERFAKETDDANLALVKMERRAFALTHQGRGQEAMALLNSDEYARFKKVYVGGMQKTIGAKNNLLEKEILHLHSLSLVSVTASTASVLVLLTTWFFASRSTRKWAAERVESEKALREARDGLEVQVKQRTADLLKANEELRHEISEHKRAEEELSETEERYRVLFEGSAHGILITDSVTGHFLDANLSICQMFGYSKAELLQLGITDIHPKDVLGHVMSQLNSQVRGGRMVSGAVPCLRKDSSVFYAEIAGTSTNFRGQRCAVGFFMDITERRQLAEKIRQMAYHDSLTGLPNRTLFSDRLGIVLAQSQRNQKSVAIAMLDLDHFKDVNDTLGHDVGDLLLKAAAKRLSAALRKGDTVARFGGDEFVLILPDLEATEDAIRVTEKIVDSFCTPFVIDSHQLMVTTSIGIAVYPHDGTEEDILLKNADIAMYQAKQSGRNRYKRYNEA